jgi:hypothetical protein
MVLVHRQRKTVLPLTPEVITRRDGTRKNDCERNASKRLLRQLRQDYLQLKLIIVEDSLASNGAHLDRFTSSSTLPHRCLLAAA